MKSVRASLASLMADTGLKGRGGRKFNRDVAAFLLSERRVNELDSLLRDVQADWAERGYVEVIASSRYPLSAKVKADITAQVRRLYPHAKRIVISDKLDKSIVGGVRISLPNRQWDLSVKGKLNQLIQLTDVNA